MLTEAEYGLALKVVERLLTFENYTDITAEALLKLKCYSIAIEQYEEVHFPMKPEQPPFDVPELWDEG